VRGVAGSVASVLKPQSTGQGMVLTLQKVKTTARRCSRNSWFRITANQTRQYSYYLARGIRCVTSAIARTSAAATGVICAFARVHRPTTKGGTGPLSGIFTSRPRLSGPANSGAGTPMSASLCAINSNAKANDWHTVKYGGKATPAGANNRSIQLPEPPNFRIQAPRLLPALPARRPVKQC